MYRWVEELHIWRENTRQRRGWILFARCRRETPHADSHTDTQKPYRLRAIWADMLHTRSDSHCPAGHTNRMDWPKGSWVMGERPWRDSFSHSTGSLNLSRTPQQAPEAGPMEQTASPVVGKMGSAQPLSNSDPHSKAFLAQPPVRFTASGSQRGARTPFSSLRPPFPGRPSQPERLRPVAWGSGWPG